MTNANPSIPGSLPTKFDTSIHLAAQSLAQPLSMDHRKTATVMASGSCHPLSTMLVPVRDQLVVLS